MAGHKHETKATSGAGVDAILARHGGLSYLEIPASDPRQSATFYENVVGWRIQGADTAEPKFNDATGHLIGRWVTGRAISREPGMLPYIYVDDVNKAVMQTEACGGEVIKSTYREGNLLIATVRDPSGNVIGLWQQAPC
jgi:predicted enzyme related to lactoylglutathione lyase